MDDQNNFAKLRAEIKRLRICGTLLFIAGYSAYVGLFSVTGEDSNPFLMMLFMFAAFSGIIMVARSFFHKKFAPLREKNKRK